MTAELLFCYLLGSELPNCTNTDPEDYCLSKYFKNNFIFQIVLCANSSVYQ